jgi:hypothetical protein
MKSPFQPWAEAAALRQHFGPGLYHRGGAEGFIRTALLVPGKDVELICLEPGPATRMRLYESLFREMLG